MKVYKLTPQGFASNSFAVTEDGKTCILIDCAQPRVYDWCKKIGLTPEAVLLTHAHFDHVGGCARLQAAGAEIYASKIESELAFSNEYLSLFGGVEVPPFTVSHTIEEGEQNIFGIRVKAIATPGHTAGGMCYIIGDSLFSGDTLFCGSAGRCDLPTGDEAKLGLSLKKLYSLAGDYKLYTGHGEDSSLERERRYNPFMRFL